MCQGENTPLRLVPTPPEPDTTVTAPITMPYLATALTTVLSRRRRIWDLGDHAHCPVVGVCMPIATLRRLIKKRSDQPVPTDDYELHCLAVGACKSRTWLAETIQKDLDQRYKIRAQQLNKLKTEAELIQCWETTLQGKEVASTFWALLMHGRCTPELETRVLGNIHMLQHQVGMAVRADHAQLDALLDENAILTRELARAQQRSQQLAQEHAAAMQRLEQENMRLRGEIISGQTQLHRTTEQLQTLQQEAPDLLPRLELSRSNRQQLERIQSLQRALLSAQQLAERQQRRADDIWAQWQAHTNEQPSAVQPIGDRHADTDQAPATLSAQSILCVGGRPHVIPIFRDEIERVGGHFLHHDGGTEESPTKLDATLAAADLVICQTGCISHDAYWRVKHHCKRTGKRCVFVDTPSKAALTRALQDLVSSS